MSLAYGFALPHWKVLSGGFTPAALFVGGQQGFFYDPSDLSTLFQDSAGTTPVTGVEQVVGLMLDKSKGLVLGSELASNILGSTSGWTFVGAATVSGGAVVFTTPPSTNASAQYNPIVSSGLWYRVQVTLTGTGQVTVQLGSAGTSATFTAPGSYSFTGIASGGTPTVLTFSSVLSGVNNFVGSVTAVSVRTLPGNHATSTGAARPTLSARVNLLTKTEQFDDGVWVKSSVTITANAAVAPDGTVTADLMYPNTTGTFRWVYQVLTASSAIYTRSVYAKAQNKSIVYIDPTGGGTAFAYFNLATGAVGTVSAGYTATITPVGNGWYRCTITNASAQALSFAGVYGVADADGSTSVTANGTDGIYIWGADLRVANDGVGIPAYQRVNTATDYDSSGFPLYLSFGGTQAMSTGSIDFTATDKMSVFAGVRKLSNATTNVVAELGDPSVSPNSYFSVFAPSGAANNYAFRSAGSIEITATSAASYAPPITNVISGIGDISGDICILNVNGAQAATDSSNQGSFNYSSRPIYIGARAGTSLFFNGRLYSLIGVGSAVSAGNISATESWVNGKTKAY